MNRFSIYVEGIKIVLKHSIYLISFLAFALFLFGFFIYIPVRTVPGNDFAFQLSLFKPLDYLLLISLSLLTSLSVNMNVFSFRHKGTLGTGISAVSQGGVGGTAGVIASIFGTASCTTCVSSLFGFLGLGTVFFLLDYRSYIVFGSIILVLFSLYFTSKKVLNACEKCNHIQLKSHKHK